LFQSANLRIESIAYANLYLYIKKGKSCKVRVCGDIAKYRTWLCDRFLSILGGRAAASDDYIRD
jgi:hypothetical protein